jgi:methionyl-tRNA formyltransferase
MKVVVFGCQQIAVDVLGYLIGKNDVDLSLVITYELPLDKTYKYKSVSDYCKENGIPVINPKLVSDNVVRKVLDIEPDIILSIYYRKIFPQTLINIPKLGCINIHPSKLPNYRGPVPTAWAIENGEEEFGITIHYMDCSIDTGDILVQKVYPIFDDETGYELYTRAMKLGSELLNNNYDAIVSGKIVARPQVGEGSYYGKKTGKYTIDWKKSVSEIRNLIRVHAKPFNPVETILFNRYFLINHAERYDLPEKPLQGGGIIVRILPENQLVVSCADGYLKITDFEIAPSITDEEQKIYFMEGNRFG